MAAAHSGASPSGHGIDLIDKYDTGRILFGILKQIADTGCAHTHKHFHKIRTGNREKGNPRLTGYSLSKKGLSRSRRAYQKKPLGNPGPYAGIFLRLPEEIHYLFQFFLFFLQARHIMKSYLAVPTQSGPAFSKIHHLGIGAAACCPCIHHRNQNNHHYR